MDTHALKGAVLGNGPSRDLYDYSADVVIGCNIPGEGYSLDATVILDVEVVWILKNNPELLNCPAIVSTAAYEKIKELRLVNDIHVMEVLPRTFDWHNSAHYAALFLTNVIECGTIDLWGCDSYFTNDRASHTDQLIKPPDNAASLPKHWNRVWNQIIADHPDVHFHFHRL